MNTTTAFVLLDGVFDSPVDSQVNDEDVLAVGFGEGGVVGGGGTKSGGGGIVGGGGTKLGGPSCDMIVDCRLIDFF